MLVDGHQARALTRLRGSLPEDDARFPPNVMYIYRKQLEEADLIVLNKTDLLAADELRALRALLAEQFPDVPLLCMSAAQGNGVEAWLDFILRDLPAGAVGRSRLRRLCGGRGGLGLAERAGPAAGQPRPRLESLCRPPPGSPPRRASLRLRRDRAT